VVLQKQIIDYLNAHYPAKTNVLNRSLAKLLIHLEAPEAVGKTLALLEQGKDDPAENNITSSSDLIMRNAQYGLDIARVLANIPPREQVYMAIVLSKAKKGWTSEQRERYFDWFAKAFRYKGGNSYIGFINKARTMALENVPETNREHLNEVSGGNMLTQSGNDLAGLPQPKGSYNEWDVETAKAVIDSGLVNRNFKQGKDMFAALLCKSCHSMRGEGGSIGPDLTQIGTRFTTTDMLVHIIEPNKEVSDQYAPYLFAMKDGRSVLGKLVNEDNETYYVSQNPFMPDNLIELSKAEVTSKKLSHISLMPPLLLNRLSGEELKDLIAYMIAAGNESHTVYTSSR
jgi:putative heme-binding domain-containing protein